ncbi:MAG: hypothetical protein JXB07_09545 [Anaerolineae bacterium]|nr:hypothetical protein [Anaerolineae bacterium]
MSRVVNLDGPGKARNQLMRTSAEIIRHLSQKSELDEEACDMAALLVYCLREIDAGIDDSALAWEKRDYWVKAEQFRSRWAWAGKSAAELNEVVVHGAWEQLPMVLAGLFPHFTDIKIAKLTRSPSLWRGAYRRLLQEQVPVQGA